MIQIEKRTSGLVPSDLYFNGQKIYLDVDEDSYLYAPSDDVLALILGGSVKATWNANGLRVGDATAPTVSLEAANGFTVAAGDITLTAGNLTGKGLHLRKVGGAQAGINFNADSADQYITSDSGIQLWHDIGASETLRIRAALGGVAGNAISWTEVARISTVDGFRFMHTKPINLLGAAAAEKTIATGVITITAGYHTVDTEGDAATDDLDTINGGRTGDLLIIVPANAARTIVAKHGTGNLNLAGGADFTMDEDDDFLMLLLIGATWQEISRSENHV